MMNILAREQREVLAQLAWSRVLLAFDFDGTLAPIVADRDRACMRARTRTLLGGLCARYPCAVISGRARADVERRVSGIPVPHLIGNHGMEPSAHLSRFAADIFAARRTLERSLAPIEGVEIEDKIYSLSIHYRSAPRRAARAAIDEAIARLRRPVRVVLGKAVVNVLPLEAPDKGVALIGLREAAGVDTALYVGDDVTDEDVFRLDQPGRLLSIRVGRSRASAASFYVRDQAQVDRLLTRLLELRPS